jgi:hypothetical protein
VNSSRRDSLQTTHDAEDGTADIYCMAQRMQDASEYCSFLHMTCKRADLCIYKRRGDQ